MKIEKITPQIATLYIGQKCEYPNDEGGKIVCFLTGVSSDGIETTYKRKSNGIVGDLLAWSPNSANQKRFAGSVMLHLRRLDSMTEEEAREVYEIENFEVWNTQMYSQDEPLNGSCLDRWWNILLEDIYIKQSDFRIGTPAVWLYLLSKGFDLFDLIPAGLAKEVTP